MRTFVTLPNAARMSRNIWTTHQTMLTILKWRTFSGKFWTMNKDNSMSSLTTLSPEYSHSSWQWESHSGNLTPLSNGIQLTGSDWEDITCVLFMRQGIEIPVHWHWGLVIRTRYNEAILELVLRARNFQQSVKHGSLANLGENCLLLTNRYLLPFLKALTKNIIAILNWLNLTKFYEIGLSKHQDRFIRAVINSQSVYSQVSL